MGLFKYAKIDTDCCMKKKIVEYTDTYEWIDHQEDRVRVGISQEGLRVIGEIVAIELPQPGQEIKKDEQIAIVESSKAATELYSPLTGKVVRVNTALTDHISLLNLDPEGEGWLYEILPDAFS